MNNEQVKATIDGLVKRSYKTDVQPKTVSVTKEMANVLGTKERQLIRVLKAVIHAIANKLFVEGIIVGTQQDEINRWLKVNRFENLQRDIFRAVVRDSEVFILTSYVNNAPKYNIVEAYDGQTGAQYIYNGDTVAFAVNVWKLGKEKYLDVYYADRIEQYSYKDDEWLLYNEIDWTDTNNQPLGIALVKFDISESDIAEAVQLQRDINEAIVDLIAVSRTMGFPQRYTSGKFNPNYLVNEAGSILRYNGQPIQNKLEVTPGSLPHFGEGTTLGQLEAATADTTVIDKLLHFISIVTTVPTFYFDGGNMPSGVALVQAETRLNTKVESHQGLLSPAFEELIKLSARLQSTFGTGITLDDDITIKWASPVVYTADLQLQMEQAEYTKIVVLKDAGLLSLEQAVRMLHPEWEDTDIQAEVLRLQTANEVI